MMNRHVLSTLPTRPCTLLKQQRLLKIIKRSISKKTAKIRQYVAVTNINHHSKNRNRFALQQSLPSCCMPSSPSSLLISHGEKEHNRMHNIQVRSLRSKGNNNNNNSLVNTTENNNMTSSEEDGAIGKSIDFDINSSIEGDESQIVIIDIGKDEILRGESGNMLYMTEGVEMSTSVGSGSNAFSKFMTGQNLFYSDYTYNGSSNDGTHGEKGQVALGTDFPSKIMRLSNIEHQPIIAQKGALLCYSHTINIQMEMVKNMTAGFFGGEGFVLMNINGVGDVFLKAGGMIIKRQLQEGEELRISSGSLVAFTSGMDYDVSMMKGIKNIMFAGEGLFITTLTGPGTVWLQSMSQDRFISSIVSRLPSRGGIPIGFGIPIGTGDGGTVASDDNDAETTDPTIPSDDLGNNDTIAATSSSIDESIQSDRNATIASARFDTNNNSPDSPSSLFGDAAADNENFSTNDDNNYGFKDDDTTSFSTGQEDNNATAGNAQDNDSFFDNYNDQTTFSTEEKEPSQQIDYDDASEEKGLFSTMWDFFNDDE